MADEEEREPLLSSSGPNHGSLPPEYTEHCAQATPDHHNGPLSVVEAVPTIAVGELPPPYTPSPEEVTGVSCRVCQTMISFEPQTRNYVVRCSNCNEATPIRAAPPGKKYVRCLCNCLLVCKASSPRVSCPRPSCKRVITLGETMRPPVSVVGGGGEPGGRGPPRFVAGARVGGGEPGVSRIICAYCGDTFFFNLLDYALATCPHCRKLSCVGRPRYQMRAAKYICFGVLFCAIGIGCAVAVLATDATDLGGLSALFFIIAIAGVGFMAAGIKLTRMKISQIIVE